MTVKQFAKESGVEAVTVLNWIRRELIKAQKVYTPAGEYWELEEGQAAPLLRRGRPRKLEVNDGRGNGHYRRSRPWESQLEAEAFFNRSRKKCQLSYKQLQVRYENGESLEGIAREAGITRERVRQYYIQYYKQFLGENLRLEVRKENIKDARKAEVMEYVSTDVTLNKLRIFSEEYGWTFEPLMVQRPANGRVNYHANNSKVIINGKKIYYKTLVEGSKFQIVNGHRWYHRCLVSTGLLNWADYVVMLEDSEERPDRGFVIPPREFFEKLKCKSGGQSAFWLYVPTEKLPVYNNNPSKIDWWEWEGRWDLIGEG